MKFTKEEFQSLSGNSGVSARQDCVRNAVVRHVSIPFREFWRFRDHLRVGVPRAEQVSIPFREFWRFRMMDIGITIGDRVSVSIPFREFWRFRDRAQAQEDAIYAGFNPFQGILAFPRLARRSSADRTLWFQSLSGNSGVSASIVCLRRWCPGKCFNPFQGILAFPPNCTPFLKIKCRAFQSLSGNSGVSAKRAK